MLLLALLRRVRGGSGGVQRAAVWRHRRRALGAQCQGTPPINVEV
jgi:hypothetical protein